MRMKFYIQGPRKQGTVNLEMREVSNLYLYLFFSIKLKRLRFFLG